MLSSLKRPHLDYFKEFYADTAMFGGNYGLPCGIDFFGADKVVFASDAPLAAIPVHVKVLDQVLNELEARPGRTAQDHGRQRREAC